MCVCHRKVSRPEILENLKEREKKITEISCANQTEYYKLNKN
jgi:hypothetical protein